MRRAMAIGFALGLCLAPASAQAFDTQPHADMTRDALTAEGFGRPGANVGMVNNYFVDYYTNPDDNPYSGHANALVGFLRFKLNHEDWLHQWVEGARRLHFDAEKRQVPMPDLSSTAGVDKEWQRLMFLTRKWVQYAGRQNNPLPSDGGAGNLAALGAGLLRAQQLGRGSEPGGRARWPRGGLARIRRHAHLVRRAPGDPCADDRQSRGLHRGEGHPARARPLAVEQEQEPHGGLNKDWNGRPKYEEAYVTAYFATRQWIRAVRTWLGNEPLWRRAQSLPNTPGLRHDVTGAEQISIFSGHWMGGGEPCLPFKCGDRTGKAGSVTSLRLALGDFHDIGPTVYRRAFNQYIPAFRDYPTEPISMPDLPSTRTDQEFTRFVKLEVLSYSGIDLGDIRGSGAADIYANAAMDGQPYTSTVINGENSFSFPRSYAPFTWIRSVPIFQRESTPVETMTVRIETGNKSGAGTDDNVYLDIGRHRFSLDKRLYDDFERRDDDTYAVALGDATRNGLTIGDISRVSIEKSKDGIAGGWFLHGVTLVVNGRTIIRNRNIDRWLEDSKRVWVAPNLTRDNRRNDVIPVWLQLKEDDFGPQDLGDINIFDRNTSLPIAYRLGTRVRETVTGSDRLSGRLSMDNGDKARVTFRISSFDVDPPPPPPPPVNTPPPTRRQGRRATRI